MLAVDAGEREQPRAVISRFHSRQGKGSIAGGHRVTGHAADDLVVVGNRK